MLKGQKEPPTPGSTFVMFIWSLTVSHICMGSIRVCALDSCTHMKHFLA